MKPSPLTPIEHAIEASEPNRVNYEITVNWPGGEPTTYVGFHLPIPQAIEKLEVLVDELRASVKDEQPDGQS
jgi:hypothetical protein